MSVVTDASRDYLRDSGRFVERWRDGRWSHFERPDARENHWNPHGR